jgi:ABC-type branched-subunit amino acid transport system ATPase component
LQWADRIYVLQRGSCVLEDTAKSARSRIEEIERSYLDDAAVP